MAPTFLFTLCIAAVAALLLVGLFASGGAGASKAQQERLARRRTEILAARDREAAATVVPLPVAEPKPAPGEAAA